MRIPTHTQVRRKAISKPTSAPSFSASAVALGRRVLRSGPMQTLVRDTAWLGHQAAGLWDSYRSWSMSGAGPGFGAEGFEGPWGAAGEGGEGGGAAAAAAHGGAFGVQPSLSRWIGHVMNSMQGKRAPAPWAGEGWGALGGGAAAAWPRGAAGWRGGAAVAAAAAQAQGAAAAEGEEDPQEEAQPDFLPMVPW